MNNQQGLQFIRAYFHDLFDLRNVDALDTYLDKAYVDDDIGDPSIDQLRNSKEYLRDLFQHAPTIGVDVVEAITQDDVISAFLNWYVLENGDKRIIRKGVAIFVVKDHRIIKRHTFIYAEK